MNPLNSDSFLQLFDGINELMVFVKDTDSTLVNSSQHFAENFGYSSADEIKGKNDFDLFPHELAVHYRNDDKEVFRSGDSKLNIVELFPDHTGDLQWIMCNKVPILDEFGDVAGLCGICQKLQDTDKNLRPFYDISLALDYLKDNYRKKLYTQELADLVGLSAGQFEKRFREIFHTSVRQYVLDLKISKSCELLTSSSLSIAEVAQRVGFYDQSAYTSRFRRKMGITPLEYVRRRSLA